MDKNQELEIRLGTLEITMSEIHQRILGIEDLVGGMEKSKTQKLGKH